ncbi:hypothetical protein GE21DRAFT_1221235, partial [Neurospora crassa]
IPRKKPPSAAKKTLASKAPGAAASPNESEGEVAAEAVVTSAGPASSPYNDAPVKPVTLEKVRKWMKY